MHFYDATLVNKGQQIITKLAELRKPGRKRRAAVKAGQANRVKAMLKRTGL